MPFRIGCFAPGQVLFENSRATGANNPHGEHGVKGVGVGDTEIGDAVRGGGNRALDNLCNSSGVVAGGYDQQLYVGRIYSPSVGSGVDRSDPATGIRTPRADSLTTEPQCPEGEE